MRTLAQVAAITLMNLRNLPSRVGTSLVVVVGIAGVVGVLVSVLAMSEGFRHTLASTGRDDRVIMLRSGSDAELSSGVNRDQATLLAALPGVARDSSGRPRASAELVVMVDLPRKGESHPNNVPFRGVQRAAFAIRDEVRLVEGRRFEPGVREVVVGRKAATQFAGLAVGSRIGFRDSDWTVVGIFESGGDVHESEIWADAEVAMSAFRRTGYQSLTARVADGSDTGLAAFRDSVSRDPRFSISVLREPEYYAKQATVLSDLINVLGYTVATFMAVGATFGALNCMYSAIASRQVEIATLRAIGFGGAPVVVSVMIEALLLSLLGGAVGGALAYVYCDGASLSTLNFNTFSQVAFDFRVTPGLLLRGLSWALVIGLAGGLLPAVRAAR
ncbi:MAG: ABC transporter permease, partial [Candidatus Rokuibacteriota bacterium]